MPVYSLKMRLKVVFELKPHPIIRTEFVKCVTNNCPIYGIQVEIRFWPRPITPKEETGEILMLKGQADAWRKVQRLCEKLGMPDNMSKTGEEEVLDFIRESIQPVSTVDSPPSPPTKGQTDKEKK